jgi:ankyrin repeat protein
MEHLLKIAEEQLGYAPDLVVNFRDDDGMTALHHAVSGANVEVAKLLLERGCKLLDKQSNADSAFHLACCQGSLDMVKAIIDNCGLPTEEVLSEQDSTGQTPLHKAATFNHTEIAKFLINLGANIDALDKFGRTVLLLAAQAGASECLRFLVSSGADSQVCDLGLRNVLHVAIEYGQDVAEAVLETSSVSAILLNGQDAHGFTPLHYASKIGYFKVNRLYSIINIHTVYNMHEYSL